MNHRPNSDGRSIPLIFHDLLLSAHLIERVRLFNSLPVSTLTLRQLVRTRYRRTGISSTSPGTVLLHVHGKTGVWFDNTVTAIRLVSTVDACLGCAAVRVSDCPA
jgi:hypothetical protein